MPTRGCDRAVQARRLQSLAFTALSHVPFQRLRPLPKKKGTREKTSLPNIYLPTETPVNRNLPACSKPTSRPYNNSPLASHSPTDAKHRFLAHAGARARASLPLTAHARGANKSRPTSPPKGFDRHKRSSLAWMQKSSSRCLTCTLRSLTPVCAWGPSGASLIWRAFSGF